MEKKKLDYQIDSNDMYFILSALRSSAMSDVTYMRELCMKKVEEGEEDWPRYVECYTNTVADYEGIHNRLAGQWKRHSGGERRQEIAHYEEIFDGIRGLLQKYKEEIEKAAQERGRHDT